MNQSSTVTLNRTVILTVTILSLALVTSIGFAAWGFIESKKPADLASATFVGKAERSIESDTAKWTGVITRTASTTEEAIRLLNTDRQALEEEVRKSGVTDAIYSYQAIRAQGPYRDRYDGYYEQASASQIVVIESKQAGSLGQFNQQGPSALRLNGFMVSSDRIEFSFSKMTELEQTLTREAAENAKEQAETMLGSQLGKLKGLDRPQLTVRSANSSDDYYARNDTTSLKKTVFVTLVATYRIK